jgi:hypothetical protein
MPHVGKTGYCGTKENTTFHQGNRLNLLGSARPLKDMDIMTTIRNLEQQFDLGL